MHLVIAIVPVMLAICGMMYKQGQYYQSMLDKIDVLENNLSKSEQHITMHEKNDDNFHNAIAGIVQQNTSDIQRIGLKVFGFGFRASARDSSDILNGFVVRSDTTRVNFP